MSGEVRFTQESGHRVPHDPLIGLDRSVDLLEQVLDDLLPYSNEESAALFLMGNSLSRRGSFRLAISYYEQMLQRPVTLDQNSACLGWAMKFRNAAAALYSSGVWPLSTHSEAPPTNELCRVVPS